MKPIILSLALALLTSAGVWSQSTFKSNYVIGDDYLEFDGVFPLSDGNICVTGYHNLSPSSGILLKISPNGDTLASKNYMFRSGATFGSASMGAGISTAGGKFAAAGNSGNSLLLAQYDMSLNLLWNQLYSIPGESFTIKNIITTPEKGFVMGINHTSGATSADGLVKTDSLGNILWQKTYTGYGPQHAMSALEKSTDGNYIFTEPVGNALLVVKTDTAGIVLWSKLLQTPANTKLTASKIACSTDSTIYIGGYNSYVKYNDSLEQNINAEEPLLIKLSAAGSVAWGVQDTTHDLIQWETFGLSLDAKGNSILAGRMHNIVTNDQETGIYKADTSGAYADGSQYFFGSSSIGLNFTSLGDHSFVGVGTTYDGPCFAIRVATDLASCSNEKDSTSVFTGAGITSGNYALTPASLAITYQHADAAVASGAAIVGTSECFALPVHLTSFTASLLNDVVHLQWKTAEEQNVAYYSLERSNAANNYFEEINHTPARNLLTAQTYNTVDEHPVPGTSYYRLRSVDADGRSTLSKIVPVNISTLGSIYISPNPVTDAVHVHINAVAAAQITLQVTDMAGKVLLTQHKTVSAGVNTMALPATFSSGMYLLKVLENGRQQSLKFVK